MTICVFSGPTLSPAEGRAELDAVFLPPVEQGDVFRLARREPAAIGIIDGYFDHVAAVWHKEILWAISQGIRVYGSASMGALRAAELEPFGMRGVGAIFESFRDARLEDDDEVAVAHGPAESGYRAASDAMVNIRATLDRAEREGVIAPATRAALERIAKERFYPDRSLRLLPRLGAAAGLPAVELDRLAAWLPANAVDLKRLDALAMLRAMREDLADDDTPPPAGFHMEHTDFWKNVMRAETEGRPDELAELPHDAVLEELRLQGATYLHTRDHGLLRDLAVSEAQRLGHGARDETYGSAAARLRERLSLDDDAEFAQWLRDNHLTPERFAAVARAEADLDKLRWARGEGTHLVDQLRLTGRYRLLLERALAKQRRLAAAGLEHPTLADTGLSARELLAWYFGRLGPLYPPDPRRHATTFGFQKVEALTRAVLREYCYLRLDDAPAPSSRPPTAPSA